MVLAVKIIKNTMHAYNIVLHISNNFTKFSVVFYYIINK